MRLAVAYPSSTHSPWCCAESVVETLEGMGHQVLPLAFRTHNNLLSRAWYPTFEQLNEVDAILVIGPEHLRKYLWMLYPNWGTLKPPKAGWLCETIDNATYKIQPDDLKAVVDVVFCCGRQDEKHGFRWLPFGIDPRIFYPSIDPVARPYRMAFIGLLYPQRGDLLKKLLPHVPDLVYGEVRALDARLQAETYATELRRIQIFVNLPPSNQCIVTKCYEAAACGCLLVTPFLPENPQEFGLLYRNLDELVGLLRHLQTKDDRDLRLQAARDCKFVREHASLESRLAVMLEAVGVRQAVAV